MCSLVKISLLFSSLLISQNHATKYDFYLDTREETSISCSSDEDCTFLGNFTCTNQTCSCPENTNCPELNFNVVVVTTLGEECDRNLSCHIDNSMCSSKKCVCQTGFVEGKSKKICLEGERNVWEACSEDIQCRSLYCDSGVCKKRTGLGDICKSSEECTQHIPFSHCKQGTCNCVQRYVADDGKCYLISRELLSPCQVDVQCTVNLGNAAKCQNEKCMCPKNYEYEVFSRKCFQRSNGSYNHRRNVGIIAYVFLFVVVSLFV